MKEAEDRYIAAAQTLSKKRAKAAVELEKAVMAELPPLKLERAKFIVALERDENARGPDGFDHIEFWVETNPGSRPGPMMKVASGGELSRYHWLIVALRPRLCLMKSTLGLVARWQTRLVNACRG